MMCRYSDDSLLNIEDALFLTRNSFKELRKQIFSGRQQKKDEITVDITDTNGFINDIEYPINNMVNSIFPIDTKLEFNTTGHQSYELIGRYASFSPILNNPITGHYRIFPNFACQQINSTMMDYSNYEDKVLIVLRGECTFVNKVLNLVKSDLNPKAIIIANDEPLRGLITMYSSTFNDDRSLDIPIIFITNEAYKSFEQHDSKDLLVRISTAPLGNWINIIISMVLSPPLLILFFYCLIQLIQSCRRFQRNKFSEKIVKNLPVYIYNKNHLILYRNFYNYLMVTAQTESLIRNSVDSESSSAASIDFEGGNTNRYKPTPSPSNPSLNNFIINGIDVKRRSKELEVLIMNDDFYPAFKCSICLDRFKPLRSRVLVLDCKHFFHESCLSNWLINFKRSCPLCNNSTIANVSNRSSMSASLIAGQLNNANYNSINGGDLESHIQFDSSSNDFLDDTTSEAHNILEDDYENVYQELNIQLEDNHQGNNTADTNINADTNHSLRLPQGNSGTIEHRSNRTETPAVSEESFKTPTDTLHERESIYSNTASFFTTRTQFDNKNTNRFSKPLHILCRYSSNNVNSREELSTSIDSDLDDNKGLPNGSNETTSDSNDTTMESNETLNSTGSTINMSTD